ncbi:MAG: SRPBCC family protein [Paraburkholderia sp.]|uniref:SRPBCC family protein n=1 Tax=Paraburkholderia sp. TaxID=1926495 RepID=UPI003C4EF2CB
MTSIYREVILQTDASNAWLALRDSNNVARVFAGVLTGVTVDGDVRTVTFAGGHVAQERIVVIDDARMRVAYTVCGKRFAHHHASMQIVPLADGQCRFVWISDFLPDSEHAFVETLVDAGCVAAARNLAT